MVNRITTIYPCGLNKGLGLKICGGSWIGLETPEVWKTGWLKCCEYNSKDEDNHPIHQKNLTNNIYIYIYIYI